MPPPGIFSLDGTGSGQGAVVLDGSNDVAMIRNRQVGSQPAMVGDQLLVYATGVERLANLTVQIGDVQVAPVSIGAVSNQPGLFRIAIAVPEAAKEGDLPLSLAGNARDGSSWRSNIVTVALDANSR
ncbi:MAG: hypothetical protein WDO73_10180 [Ignavibacteriota bacterium]